MLHQWIVDVVVDKGPRPSGRGPDFGCPARTVVTGILPVGHSRPAWLKFSSAGKMPLGHTGAGLIG
jgi:hypothetical protein